MFLGAIDFLISSLICFTVVFSPWAFGSCVDWAVTTMNILGCLLGVLWLVKLLWCQLAGEKICRWASKSHFTIRLLAVASFLVLVYCLISAVNARATYVPQAWEFRYHPAIAWLPHSYDADRSWSVFWQNLGLAGLFWALRDWLLSLPPQEGAERSYAGSGLPLRDVFPARLRMLLWILAVSGGLLAIQGILQRLGGGDKVLWLIKPVVNGNNVVQFGAFPYRANAAQYFNLLWPVILGLCWLEFHARANRHRWITLLVSVFFMAICPLMTASRAGAGVTVLNLALATAVLWWNGRKKDQGVQWFIPLVAGVVLTAGLLLGWSYLGPRLGHLSVDAQSRADLTQVGREIAADNPVYGTGPGSLQNIYQLYMHNWEDFWPAQLHNDWMETLATYGWVGFALIMACLALALSHWFLGSGLPTGNCFVWLLWIALGGCLVHARFDWPFECHAVLTLFIVICAILSCLSRPAASLTSDH